MFIPLLESRNMNACKLESSLLKEYNKQLYFFLFYYIKMTKIIPSSKAELETKPPNLPSTGTINQLCEALDKTSFRPISEKVILNEINLDHFFNDKFTFKYDELTEPQKDQLAKYCYYRLTDDIPNVNWPADLKTRIFKLNQSPSAAEGNLKIMKDIALFKSYLIQFSPPKSKVQIVRLFNNLLLDTQITICSNKNLLYAAKQFIQSNTPRKTKKSESRSNQNCRAQSLKAKKSHEQKSIDWASRKSIKK